MARDDLLLSEEVLLLALDDESGRDSTWWGIGATERALRERLHAVLLDGAEPDPRTALLVGLLRPNDMVQKLVPRNRRKEAGRRAKEIADAGVVGTAVKDAVQGVQTAVLAATLAASTAATTSGNGSS